MLLKFPLIFLNEEGSEFTPDLILIALNSQTT